MYAILDIETTGGKYNEEGITEIAIYRFDGHTVVDQFASLINPERPIQPFVVNLTGINNDMLRLAPKFYEVAKRIIEITSDCVIVAHNALFDHRILTTEFDRLGYQFERESLCTVELAKKLLPDMPSYSLGKLVRNLGIPVTDRHRAQGDAKATVALFKILLAKDDSKEILSQTIKKESKKQLEPKLLDLIEGAPSETGVYYMYNDAKRLIYIGVSKNIKKKITQHFTNENRKSKRLQLETASVSFEKTGNELIAQLKENEEIVKNKPLYNRGRRGKMFSNQLVSSVDDEGYINLRIEKTDGRKRALMTFATYQQAKLVLSKITEENELCMKFNGLQETSGSCVGVKIGKCLGACIQHESATEYNERVKEALDKENLLDKSSLLIDRGRDPEERSIIWIENGTVKGYGFYNLNFQINKPEILKNILKPISLPKDAKHIIQSYLRKNRILKTIDLPS